MKILVSALLWSITHGERQVEPIFMNRISAFGDLAFGGWGLRHQTPFRLNDWKICETLLPLSLMVDTYAEQI